jgi:hypothetical protein
MQSPPGPVISYILYREAPETASGNLNFKDKSLSR